MGLGWERPVVLRQLHSNTAEQAMVSCVLQA